MKRARLHLTWDELVAIQRGLEADTARLERFLEAGGQPESVRRIYESDIALNDALSERIKEARTRCPTS